MRNTAMGCASDLLTILGISNIKKCEQFFQRLNLYPNTRKKQKYHPKLHPVCPGLLQRRMSLEELWSQDFD
jgi:hypothetical protein